MRAFLAKRNFASKLKKFTRKNSGNSDQGFNCTQNPITHDQAQDPTEPPLSPSPTSDPE